MEKRCLSSMTQKQLAEYIASLGQPSFRAGQIYKWLHQKLVTDFDAMTDQPKALLERLREECTIAAPSIRRRLRVRVLRASYMGPVPPA